MKRVKTDFPSVLSPLKWTFPGLARNFSSGAESQRSEGIVFNSKSPTIDEKGFRFSPFSDDRSFLADARSAIEAYLTTLRLKIHPIKSQLFETRLGANFVGFRVLPERIRVRNDHLRRSRHRLRTLQADYAQGRITLHRLNQSIQSWVAHLEHGDTWRLRHSIFETWSFRCPEIH